MALIHVIKSANSSLSAISTVRSGQKTHEKQGFVEGGNKGEEGENRGEEGENRGEERENRGEEGETGGNKDKGERCSSSLIKLSSTYLIIRLSV